MATENPIVNPYSGYLEGESARCFDEGVAAERARITPAIENASRHGAAAERARLLDRLTSSFAVKLALAEYAGRLHQRQTLNPFDAMGHALDQVRAWIEKEAT